MTWEFDRDDKWQRELARKFLDPFYRQHYQIERYPGDHPMQTKHVDVTLRHVDGRKHNVDEKIIRGLRKGGPAEKINLETWSCSIPGLERLGWISKKIVNEATILFECHAEDVSSLDPEAWKDVTFLDCVWIPFIRLRDWFWDMGEERWEEKISPQINRSISRKVPIDEILSNIDGAHRFRLDAPIELVPPPRRKTLHGAIGKQLPSGRWIAVSFQENWVELNGKWVLESTVEGKDELR